MLPTGLRATKAVTLLASDAVKTRYLAVARTQLRTFGSGRRYSTELEDALNDRAPATKTYAKVPLKAPASEQDSTPRLVFESDTPVLGDGSTDWSKSFHGLSSEPFPKEVSDVLQQPIDPMDVEMKPDGLAYLPEIKYRRILNKAFGPGGWGLAPRGPTMMLKNTLSREYGLVCLGRLVAVARGEQDFFSPDGIPTATEGLKSNALMRCCKDLGIASELWDPRWIRDFKKQHCVQVFAQHQTTRARKSLWRRKDASIEYPYKET